MDAVAKTFRYLDEDGNREAARGQDAKDEKDKAKK